MSALKDWCERERAIIAKSAPLRGQFMLGGLAYGEPYLSILEKYCLASIECQANAAALSESGAVISLYTDQRSYERMLDILTGSVRRIGIEASVRVIPEDAMRHPDKFEILATAQHLTVAQAAQSDMAYHTFLPDQIYSERFFPAVLDMGRRHKNVVHNGLNASPSAAAGLERYRLRSGALEVPAKTLNDIAWAHVHGRMLVMNGRDLKADRWINGHYQLWRARDRVPMFGPHNSLSYLAPSGCKKLVAEVTNPVTGGTLDCHCQRLAGADYYVPQIEDEATLIGLEHSEGYALVAAEHDCSRAEYIKWCLDSIQNNPEYICYYAKPMAILETSPDEQAPTLDEVLAWQGAVVEMLNGARA